MYGWLIGNQFLRTENFQWLYDRLLGAAQRQNVNLVWKSNCEVLCRFSRLLQERRPDFAIFWDKDEALSWMLEAVGIRLFNPAQAIADCDNKALTYARLLAEQIPMPKTIPVPMTYARVGYTDVSFVREAGELLGFPMVVKECYGSFGAQVYRVESEEECVCLLREKGTTPMLFQEYLANTAGQDVRIYMVGGNAEAAIRRTNPHDFRANVNAGGKAESYVPTEEETALAKRACRCLNLDFGGVDILWDAKGKPLVCEVNSNAHFRGIYEASGVDIAEKILKHVKKVCG